MIERSDMAEALLASPSDAIVATDREGAVVFWGPGAARIFGFSAEETVGTSMDMIIPEALRERHWRGYREAMETGRSRYGDGDVLSVPALTKDGRRISVEFTIVMLRDERDRAVGTVAVMRDVTKRFEQAKELRRALDSLRGAAPPRSPAA